MPPRVTPFVFEDNPVSSGHTIQVACLVSEGDLPLDIEWTLNGKSLENSADVSVGKVGKRNSILSIDAVSYENAGNYTCTAENKAGMAQHSAELLVNGYWKSFLIYK